MASPYTAGALEARDIAEATDVNATNVSEASSIAAAAGVNVTDVNTASTFFGLIADDTGELMVGQISFSTTSVLLASTLTAAPDFVMVGTVTDSPTAHSISVTATSTTITFTSDSTTTTLTLQYILGYTA